MTDTDGYNGWKNYETWAMSLWMDNDEGSYSHARALAAEIIEEHEEEDRRYVLADALKVWQEEDMPDLPASVWSSLLNASFSEVDWFEIAGNLIEEETEE
jgi:hypothetical protein